MSNQLGSSGTFSAGWTTIDVTSYITNNGFIIIADTELNDRFYYKSSDSTTASNRPKLVIQYTIPQGFAPGRVVGVRRDSNAGRDVNSRDHFASYNFAPPYQGSQYSSQPDGTNGLDTYIYNDSAMTNFGTEIYVTVGEGNGGTNKINRSLIKFDLFSIPSNAVITSASLSLWTGTDYSDNDRTIRVYRLKVPFEEDEATWNESASGVSWQSAGASGANDRESTDIGSVLVLANEASSTEKQISLNTTKVQEMITGTFTNNGFIIIADTELNDRFNYKSSDSSTASNRPKLVIEYTTSSSTPTPRNRWPKVLKVGVKETSSIAV